METQKITKDQLKSWLDGGEDVLLVDVLPPECYGEKHIAGAKNAPVYEVAFLKHIEKLTNDKNRHIVLYSENPDSLATVDGAIKLVKAGYAKVEIFPGGLAQWEKAGWDIERGPAVEVVYAKDGEHELDMEASVIGWVGRNANNAHRGRIALKSGYIIWEDGRLVGGEIVLDMKTIKDEDLTDDMWRGILEAHLKSSDFFDVEQYREASFVFKQAVPVSGALGGENNYTIKGMLTIKDVSREIEFSAMIASAGDGSIKGQAHFDFDRTLWNVRYGSERFFEKLGMHLVNDIVTLELFLVAKK